MSILECIQKIRTSNLQSLQDYENLILSVGLNNELLNEQPTEYSEFYGKGLRIWQYPNQLSKFAKKISNLKINSYMEIGCRFGGTFIFNSEILHKKNAELKLFACDIIPKSDILLEYENYNKFLYFNISSATEKFKNICKEIKPEFVFIDGDHSYEGVLNDYKIFENMNETKYLAFHDIYSDVCPGVVKFWKQLKMQTEKYDFFEFVEQYESVKGNYLGIGLAIKK